MEPESVPFLNDEDELVGGILRFSRSFNGSSSFNSVSSYDACSDSVYENEHSSGDSSESSNSSCSEDSSCDESDPAQNCSQKQTPDLDEETYNNDNLGDNQLYSGPLKVGFYTETLKDMSVIVSEYCCLTGTKFKIYDSSFVDFSSYSEDCVSKYKCISEASDEVQRNLVFQKTPDKELKTVYYKKIALCCFRSNCFKLSKSKKKVEPCDKLQKRHLQLSRLGFCESYLVISCKFRPSFRCEVLQV